MSRLLIGSLVLSAVVLARPPVPAEKDVDVIKRGASEASEKAVSAGLRWVALHQGADGRWSLNALNANARTQPYPGGKMVRDATVSQTSRSNDTAATAFACLAFLSAGVTTKATPRALGHEYHKGLNAGIRWLVKNQAQAGSSRGYYGGDMYTHAMATQSVCEAYGATKEKAFAPSAQSGVDYLLVAQHDGGGWRYSPRQAGDLSVTGFVVRALTAAQDAGLKVPPAAMGKLMKFVGTCAAGDGYSYTPGSAASPAMTAVGAFTQARVTGRRDAAFKAGAKAILDAGPSNSNLYREYYATHAMYYHGGKEWEEWNAGAGGKKGQRALFVARQDDGVKVPAHLGSWSGDDQVGGRLGATAFAIMTLQVYRKKPLNESDP